MAKKYRIGLSGGLGDALMHTVIIEALKKNDPSAKIILYGKENCRAIFLHNPSVDKFIRFNFFARLLYHFRLFIGIKHIKLAYGSLQPSLNFRNIHAIEIMANMIGLWIRDEKIRVYLTEKEDNHAKELLESYKNPVLLQITSNSSSNQNWPIENWNRLVNEMTDYTFLQVGTDGEERVEGSINLLGKTDLRETFALLKNVKSFVAVDSFLNNASAAFLTKGCVLFGPSPPDIWGYDNNINLFKAPKCGPCIDTLRMTPCPYNKICMREISVEEVKMALRSQMNAKADGVKIII